MKHLRLCLICIAVLSFCIPMTNAQESTEEPPPPYLTGTMTHDDIERTYTLYIPTGYDATQPTPLVITLHGAGGQGDQMIFGTGMGQKAEETGYLIVSPDGLNGRWRYLTQPGGEAGSFGDDVGFISALIDHIGESYPIDSNRIYVVGFSNGGIMALRLRCSLSDRLAGVIAVGATVTGGLSQECLDAEPFSTMIVMGTQDQAFPWQGFAGIENNIFYLYFSMAQTVGFLNSLNACGPRASLTGTISTQASTYPVVLIAYGGCANNTNTFYLSIEGMDHRWPSGLVVGLQHQESGEMRLGDIDDVFWNFFEAHVRESSPEPEATPQVETTPEADAG